MKAQSLLLPRSLAVAPLALSLLLVAAPLARSQQPMMLPGPQTAPAGPQGPPSSGQTNTAVNPYYDVTGNDDHLKMVVNSSRILRLTKKIPQVQVNNPDILDVVPISPNEVQISSKRTGVTQVNLWGDDKRIYTVNVIVMGDAAELIQLLKAEFPRTTLNIVPINGSSVLISGYVEQQEAMSKIVAVATEYFPHVINNMTVSGSQQGIVHIKIVEVSRTKMRNMGFDWATFGPTTGEVFSGVNGLLTTASAAPLSVSSPDNVFKFTMGGANAFYGVLNALREDDLAKLDSEPDVVAISGRPAYVLVGGELGYQVTNALSGTMVGFKEYGTRLDIVPVVLGNGRMRIDVRTRVSEPDAANSVGGIPAIKTREVETGVELRAGQTLAIAGLIEARREALVHGLPWISEVPYLGVPFRSVSHEINEVELLVLLTPDMVDGMEPGQVPTCLPGSETTDPTDWELFFKGQIEVPNCCAVDGSCPACNGKSAACESVRPEIQQNPSISNQVAANNEAPEPGFVGPVGYDILK